MASVCEIVLSGERPEKTRHHCQILAGPNTACIKSEQASPSCLQQINDDNNQPHPSAKKETSYETEVS
jgi:hypothetical protein